MKVLRIKCPDCDETYNYYIADGFWGDIHCKGCYSRIHTEPDMTQYNEIIGKVHTWLREQGYDGVAKEFERDFRR